MNRYTLISVLFMLCFVACRNGREEGEYSVRPGKNEMAELNRYMVQKDRERIQNYIERKKLDMIESPSGLWYVIIAEGKGNFFSDYDKVIIEYECSLIDGTVCYSSSESGPKEIILGRTKIEPGLDQGLRMLKPGGEAIFIIPPFLAYGLTGDGNLIPPRTIIVYNIRT